MTKHFVLPFIIVAALASIADGAIRTEKIEYEHGGKTLEGMVAWDDARPGKRPGVLVVHEWWGLNDYARERAKQLAELGYVAFALDMYGKGMVADSPDEARSLATPFYADRSLMRGRATAGLQQLASHPLVDPERLGAIGYCFGGTVVLELARSGAELDGVVSFHGGLVLGEEEGGDATKIKAELLVCNGADDPMVPDEQRRAFRKAMDDADVTWTFVEFSDAVHSFTNPEADKRQMNGVAYNERADRQSWDMMRSLFERVFKPAAP